MRIFHDPTTATFRTEELGVHAEEASVNYAPSAPPLNPYPSTQFNQLTRREVWWRRLDNATSHSPQSLEAIARIFADRLAAFASISFFSPLRRIRAGCGSHFPRPLHCCPGYSREEINLASDISRSAIITHEYPSESEVCLGCGQLVRYDLGSAGDCATVPDGKDPSRGSVHGSDPQGLSDTYLDIEISHLYEPEVKESDVDTDKQQSMPAGGVLGARGVTREDGIDRQLKECSRCQTAIESGRWTALHNGRLLCDKCLKEMYLPKVGLKSYHVGW